MLEWDSLNEAVQIVNIFIMILWAMLLIFYRKLARPAELLSLIGSIYLFITGIYFRRSFHNEQSSSDAIFILGYNYGLVHQLMQDTYDQTHTAIVIEILLTVVKLTLLKDIKTNRLLAHVFICYYILALRIKNEVNERNLFKKWFDLHQSLRKFKEFLHKHLPASLVIFDQALDKILFKNTSFERQFEAHCTKVNDILKYIKIDPQDEKYEEIETALKEKECTLHDLLLTRKSNRHQTTTTSCIFNNNKNKDVCYEAKAFSFIWDGKNALAVLLNDITYQRDILSLKLANENKEKAIAIVSHELRNPVQGLLGIVELMERNSTDSGFNKSLNLLKINIHLLINILNTMLDLQQLRAGKLKPNISRVELDQIMTNVKQLYEFQCSQKGLDISVEIHPSTPKVLLTDKSRLSQVLINLTANAIKFTCQGGITLGAALDPEDRERVKIWVKDTGIGIKEEDKSKLFKMFAKLEDGSSLNHEGVGLGLMISNSIVKALNRSQEGIEVDGKHGEGAVFYFSIPIDYNQVLCSPMESCELSIALDDVELSIDQAIERSVVVKKNEEYFKINTNDSSLNYLKTSGEESLFIKTKSLDEYILVADDSPFNLFICQSLIQNKGYQICVAHNGKEAIEKVKSYTNQGATIVVIFMDFEMPIMNGLDAALELRKLMTERKVPKIPIIGLSATDIEAAADKWKSSGMDDYICKPLTQESLEKILSKHLKI